ncbi:TetR/AcrR family transcriptional regulator [Microbacterium sp. QXD-8]|uniref:TetR/AcrR family transcriptional regulator n=1 Tax=Microbacterium psychrotolerans TaxID=3068321 RepID=A0ABU0Z1J3_9MICO|nr:TetR/AcrR family transcriptional regulator [Microbacterium sp. QXD-8]MDQ7878432.1 TetR/AcrR family transcriptional regulator [Microbacterium sp. QXD-8]
MTSVQRDGSGATALDEPAETGKRLSSDERRRQILVAALAVFGTRGYEGATTDEVARAAGVSQPYVVRLFGSKENLFLATIEDALTRLLAAFRAALAAEEDDGLTAAKRIGQAYVDLIEVRGLHQTLAHAYLLGSNPVIGAAARRGFAAVWRFFREEMGIDADEARAFMAEGMLISTMIGLRIVDDYGSDPQITELFRSCFPSELPHVLDVLPRGDERW